MDPLTQLAHRACAGEPHAFDRFVESGYEQVWRLCAGLVDAQSADDLAQETFIRALRALPGFRGGSTGRTWLFGIARHVCLDELRGRVRRRRRDDAIGAVTELLAPDPSEEILVADALRRLDPERRAAFVLTQLLGLPYDEAAAVCECPVGTVRSRVARARADLVDGWGHSGWSRGSGRSSG